LGNELTQPARTDQQYAVCGLDLYLLLDFQRRGEGFGEDCHFIGDRIGDAVEVGNW
jgi:hypothetical protein